MTTQDLQPGHPGHPATPPGVDGQPARGGRAGTAGQPTFGELVASASRDLSGLLHAEIELAKAELRADVKAALRGIAMFVVAAVLGVFLLVMLLIAFAEGLVAAGLVRWGAYLVVAGVLLLLAGLIGLIGLASVKKVKPPQRTIETTRETVAWARKPRQAPAPSGSGSRASAEPVNNPRHRA